MPEFEESTDEPVPVGSLMRDVLQSIDERQWAQWEQSANEPAASLYRGHRLQHKEARDFAQYQDAEFATVQTFAAFTEALKACLEAAFFHDDAQAVLALSRCVDKGFAQIPRALEGDVFAQRLVLQELERPCLGPMAWAFRGVLEGGVRIPEDAEETDRTLCTDLMARLRARVKTTMDLTDGPQEGPDEQRPRTLPMQA